jgi:hypothetical protein
MHRLLLFLAQRWAIWSIFEQDEQRLVRPAERG